MANTIPLSNNVAEYILSNFGQNFYKNYEQYIFTDVNTYVRISPIYEEKIIIENLKAYGIELEKIPFIKRAYKILKGNELLGKTIEFTIGAYYIQSLSSMIPPLLLNPQSGDKVLDLCAAPGSKSTEISELMENQGTLYVNEPNLDRIKGLIFNIDKGNAVNIGAIKGKGELLSKKFENYFDKILADVPCSGLGILQKKGEINNWWNKTTAEKLSELQFKLLVSAVKMLKVGGELIYSTCTLTLEENEYLIDKFIKKYPVEILPLELPIPSHEAYISTSNKELSHSLKNAKRIIPWEINSEGFFIAKLKKVSEVKPDFNKGNTAKNYAVIKDDFINAKDKKIRKYLEAIANYYGFDITVLEQYKYRIKNNDIYFIDKNWETTQPETFMRIGRKFALTGKKDNVLLQSYAVGVLAKFITQNIIELTEKEDMEKYFSGGVIKKFFDEQAGQKIIKINGYLIGTAIYNDNGLKSQYPRALRTHQVVLPF